MSDKRKQIVLPIVILLVGMIGAIVIVKSRRPAPLRSPEEYAPLVRVIEVVPEARQLSVSTQGTVRPRTESTLVAEVSGRVTAIAPAFAAGGFFEKDEVLVWIDDRDYQTAVVTASSAVAQARVAAELEEAQAQLSKTLAVRPYNATAHYEIALVLSELGDSEAALEHLRTALAVWSEADPAFEPAQRARQKLDELTSAT